MGNNRLVKYKNFNIKISKAYNNNGDKVIFNNVLELIGNTPIVKINNLFNNLENDVELYAKLESRNPGGSSKDRIAYKMISDLYYNKIINNDTTIIEVTSGNTGIGLAMVCAYLNLNLIVIMSESATIERVKLIKKYGARVILLKKEISMNEGIEIAKALVKKIENSYFVNQFENSNNIEAHYESTALEILNDFKESLDSIIVGMGSTGTIMGISKRLKEIYPKIKIIGVEPKECPIYSENKIGENFIPGISNTFIPYIYNNEYVDQIVVVNKEEAFLQMEKIMKKEGISVGPSSGAVLAGAIKYIKENDINNKKILMIFPDSIDKYLSL